MAGRARTDRGILPTCPQAERLSPMNAAVQPALPPPAPPGVLDALRRLFARHETVRYLVAGSLKADHRDKLLGRVWSLLDPLLFMLVYLIVFGFLFNQARSGKGGAIEFIIYLLPGVLAWRFFDGTVNAASGCIRSNRGLIHEINFPKAVFPVSLCLARLSDFLWGLGVMLILVGIIGFQHVTWHLLWVPLIVAVQFCLTLGIAFIVAYLGAFFADTANIVSVVLRLGFYASPVFYRVSRRDGGIVPEEYLHYYMLNPIACFFEAYRDAILRMHAPDLRNFGYAAGVSLILLILGFSIFSRGEGQFAKYV